jgi:lipopolysaccharide transport system ATP-binding protein
MTDLAIRAEGLGKAYRIGAAPTERYRTLRDAISSAAKRSTWRSRGRRGDTFWALKDVSFEVRQGDTLGVIGRNGAGKSTLLKILSRITQPTTGRADMYGRLASLLEVGTGFHPELTGRENVYLNGAILGMRRVEIDRRFEEIVAFAEVEEFLDTPVKRYSSGMYMRLAFAVAAHLESEILVVDEVLAVGDAEFQRKCLSKMGELSRGGRTVLFVSHNLAAVESLCRSAILLEQGSIVASGGSSQVVQSYQSSAPDVAITSTADRMDRQGSGRVRIVGIKSDLRTGARSSLTFAFECQAGVSNVSILAGIYTVFGESVGWLSNDMTGDRLPLKPGQGLVRCTFERGALVPGRYTINVHVSEGGRVADYLVDAAAIDVAEGDYFGTGVLPPNGHGTVLLDHRWDVG